ncbi:hypothetical protein RclHR1_08830003 [Rhizophagus clarus]|uniref:Uncharacterized protein n=1 Tax=Rhizophagus clarus TaxID=94130 RepID=A0A2Z6S4J7_9GLOM|nr:hypothetical protein RclHR1_08830003 [Rhizophagus clarus]GES86348.1 hypothetical protein GLOIN_2v1607977 [Rhizophagus clarus]
MPSSSAKNPQIEAAMQEGSMRLDSLIETFSSLLLQNIKALIPSEKIMVVFNKYYQSPTLTINDVRIDGSEFDLYDKNGYYIIKEFHKEIGNYLKEKFEGLKWNVEIYPAVVQIEMIYNIDYNEIRKYSKKIGGAALQ